MLTNEKLLRLMTDLESETVERTRAFDKADKMGQAICAFANDLPGRGVPGYLLLGVEDNGQLSHRRVSDEQMTALGGLKTEGNLLPQPSMSIEKFSFDDGDVVAIEVFPTTIPPIRFKGQTWVRVGARKAMASEDDLHIFEERRQHSAKRFETLPCSEASINDLDLDLFKNKYLPRAIKAEVIGDDPRSVEEQLAALRFYNLKDKVPTNLGMILFGKHPEMYVPSAYVQYVKFSGSDNSGDILAEHAYKGPLLRTIDEIDAFVKVGIAQPHPVKVSALKEEMFFNYPDWAVRELLLNATIHRDYQLSNAPIKFYDYNGARLEISNPGGLYGLAKPDNFPSVNDYRNPLLAGVMKVMGFVNQYNRGIAKVKQEMATNGNPPPTFDVNKLTEFRVTVLVSTKAQNIVPHVPENGTTNGTINAAKPEHDTMNGTINAAEPEHDTINGTINAETPIGVETKILTLIAMHPGIQRKELSVKLGISLRSLARVLQKMTSDPQNAQIEHRGSNKTGGWFRRT